MRRNAPRGRRDRAGPSWNRTRARGTTPGHHDHDRARIATAMVETSNVSPPQQFVGSPHSPVRASGA